MQAMIFTEKRIRRRPMMRVGCRSKKRREPSQRRFPSLQLFLAEIVSDQEFDDPFFSKPSAEPTDFYPFIKPEEVTPDGTKYSFSNTMIRLDLFGIPLAFIEAASLRGTSFFRSVRGSAQTSFQEVPTHAIWKTVLRLLHRGRVGFSGAASGQGRDGKGNRYNRGNTRVVDRPQIRRSRSEMWRHFRRP